MTTAGRGPSPQRRGRQQDVEVVEEDLDTPADTSLDTPAAPARTSRRRRRLLVGGAVLAVAVAAAATAQGVLDAREDRRLARLVDVPGLVHPLDGPPVVLWEDTESDRVFSGVRTAGDLLLRVLPATTGTGSVDVEAVDARTGGTRWRVAVLPTTVDPADVAAGPGVTPVDPRTGQTLAPATGGVVGPVVPSWRGDAPPPESEPPEGEPTEGGFEVLRGGGTCVEHPGDASRATCLVHDWTDLAVPGPDGTVTPPPVTSALLTLDARDGATVADLTDVLPAGAMTLTRTDDLLVVAGPREGDAVPVVAADPDGTVRWTRRIEVSGPGSESPYVDVLALGDDVVLRTQYAVVHLDGDGAEVRRSEAASTWTAPAAGDRLYVGGTGARTRDGRSAVGVWSADGAVEVTGDVPATVDDGSVPGLLLTDDAGRLRAWDADGAPRWTADVAGGVWSLVVLDGRVHVRREADVVTLDARTGEELWRTDALRTATTVVTDGRVLVGIASRAEGGTDTELVGLSTSQGRVVWRVPVDREVGDLQAHHGLLLVLPGWFDSARPATLVLGSRP